MIAFLNLFFSSELRCLAADAERERAAENVAALGFAGSRLVIVLTQPPLSFYRASSGKTLLAKAIATRAQLPLFDAEKVMKRREENAFRLFPEQLKCLFEHAHARAPSLVLIDPIDPICFNRNRAQMPR